MTDFKQWDRANLEAFAVDSQREIEALREELSIALQAWRQAVTPAPVEQPK